MKTKLAVSRFHQHDEMAIEFNKIYQLNHSGISDVYVYRDYPNSNNSTDIVEWRKNSRCLNNVIDKYGESTQIELVNIKQEDNSINTNINVNNTTPFNLLSGEGVVFKIILSCYSQGGDLEITLIN